MLRAISPGNDAFNFKNLYQKKTKNILKSNSSVSVLPNIKQMRDQTTTTEEIKILPNGMNITNYIYPGIQKIQYEPSFRDLITLQKNNYGDSLNDVPNFNFKNSVNLINTGRNSKLFFNKNYKLKSIEKSMIKSNSSLNLINSEQTFTVINIPKNNLNKNIYKGKYFNRASSLPKLNFGNKSSINNDIDNKCNYIYLKFTGKDKSNNIYKKKKFMVINSHKVIESLQSISMPDDHYGQKLIDIIESRINSGFYRKIKYNFNSNNSQNSNKYIYQNINYNKDIISSNNNNENNKNGNKHDSSFLTDIYDNNLFPDKNNKYNYKINKIFLTNILNKVCKKMVEIRDIKNRTVTKKEIREEYLNELNKLRDDLYNNQKYNIINNNIYNINSSTNIINIDLSNNNSILNEISTIEELQENNLNIDTTNNDKDKDKQYLTSNIFQSNDKNTNLNSNYTIEDEVENKKNLEDIYSKYKIISADRNKECLRQIKDKLKIKHKDKTLHDSCYNLYTNNMSKGTGTHTSNSQMKRMRNIIRKNLYQNNYFPSLTENFYSDEEKLNNVDKFLLKTKELRYTFNLNEKNEDRRNYSYDLEGNIHHSFDAGPKLSIYNFDEVYDEIGKELSKTNSNEQSKINTLKEMIKFFMTNRNNLHKIKFNDEITRKYFAFMFPFLNFEKRRKISKKKRKKITKKKQVRNIIQEISKKIHKKIFIKGGRLLKTDTKKYRMKKHFKTDENYKSINRPYLSDDDVIQNERNNTDNIYLEIETNSSEYTDIPSELDSEIEEMIRIKREKEKRMEKEEGIYAQKKEEKRRGGDFIISNPNSKNRIKNLKQNYDENKKAKNQIKNEYNSMKEDNNKKLNLNSNIGNYLKINENGVIDTKSFKGKSIISKNTLNLTKTSQDTTNPNTKRQKGFLDMKLSVDNSPKNVNKNIFRQNSIKVNDNMNNNNLNKDGDKKNNRNKDIKKIPELNINKKNKTPLENIVEEESKETKRIRKGDKNAQSKGQKDKDSKNRKNNIKYRNLSRKDINMNEQKSGSKEEKTSDYEAYSLNNELPSDNRNKRDNGDNDLPIHSKYNYKGTDGLVNDEGNNQDNINESKAIKGKDNLNNDNIDKGKIIGDKINQNQESEEEELSEILPAPKRNSITLEQESFLSSLSEDDNQKIKQLNLTSSYFRPKKLEFYSKKKKAKKTNKIEDISIDKNKNEENEGEGDDESDKEEKEEREEKEEEEIENKKRIKRKKKKVKVKDIKGLFSEENNKEEIKKEEKEEVKVEEIPKKIGWEEKFKMFKNYIQELKYMTRQQFIDDSLKFLKENEKGDYLWKSKLGQEDRINQYKEFLLQTKKRRNNYNEYYTSHIVFTPGCVFNTGDLCQ